MKEEVKSKNFSVTRMLVVMAMGIALALVSTIVIAIPSPLGGFVNVSDAMIFVLAILFGPIPAMISGGLGCMLGDIISGFYIYAPATLIIKALEGLVCGLLIQFFGGKMKGKVFLPRLFAMLLACLVMVFGYFFYECFLLNPLTAFYNIVFNLIQAVMCVGVGCVLAPKMPSMEEILRRKN